MEVESGSMRSNVITERMSFFFNVVIIEITSVSCDVTLGGLDHALLTFHDGIVRLITDATDCVFSVSIWLMWEDLFLLV